METSRNERKIKLTGLWKGESKEGTFFLSGAISPTLRLLVFENRFRKRPTDPHYIAFIAAHEARGSTSSSGETQNQDASGENG